MTSRQEILTMTAVLETEFEKNRANQEFQLLKQDEARRGGEFAFPAWFSVLEAYRNEKVLLEAHANILDQMIRKAKFKPTREIMVLLARIHAPPGVNVI